MLFDLKYFITELNSIPMFIQYHLDEHHLPFIDELEDNLKSNIKLLEDYITKIYNHPYTDRWYLDKLCMEVFLIINLEKFEDVKLNALHNKQLKQHGNIINIDYLKIVKTAAIYEYTSLCLLNIISKCKMYLMEADELKLRKEHDEKTIE